MNNMSVTPLFSYLATLPLCLPSSSSGVAIYVYYLTKNEINKQNALLSYTGKRVMKFIFLNVNIYIYIYIYICIRRQLLHVLNS